MLEVIDGDKPRPNSNNINIKELLHILSLEIPEVNDILYHALESVKAVYNERINGKMRGFRQSVDYDEKVINIDTARLLAQIEQNELLRRYILFLISTPEYMDAVIEEHYGLILPLVDKRVDGTI